MTTPTLSSNPTFYGADAIACFYTPVNINWFDQEPGSFQTSNDEIKGLVTGVKQLGSWFQMGYVGEQMDIRWFGATDKADDWGDGGNGAGPFGVGVNNVTNRIYVSNALGGNVTVINGATHKRITSILTGSIPNGIGVNEVTNKIYVSNGGGGNLAVIDGASNTIDTTVTIGAESYGVGVETSLNKIYVSNSADNTVSVIDGVSNTVSALVAVGVKPLGVTVNSTTHMVYVSNYTDNTVSVIDAATDSVTATISVGNHPTGVAVNNATNKIYVSLAEDNTVSVIDGVSNTILITLTVGSQPGGIGVNVASNKIYVTNGASNNVTVIDGSIDVNVATVAAKKDPVGVGVNAGTDEIYVANYKSEILTVIDGSTDTPLDTDLSDGFVHTYDAPGLYYIKTNGDNGANAVRQIKIVYRHGNGPTGVSVENEPGNFLNQPIYEHIYGYPVVLEPATEGSIESAFAMKFSIKMSGTYPFNSNVGYTVTRGGMAVFAEVYDTGTRASSIRLVAGGFTTNRALKLSSKGDSLTGTAYDFIYWINKETMREQQYDDLSIVAYAAQGEISNNLFVDPTNPTPLVTDFSGLGYTPQHFLQACRPDYAVAHMLQHIRISVTVDPHKNPKMQNQPTNSEYGNIAQFTNILIDPEYDEKTALGGFHAFSVSAGGVLSNMRQMLENTGSILHSRSDMFLVMAQKPFYKNTLPEPRLSIDLLDALSDTIISEGDPVMVYKVQIEKPMLAVTLPANARMAGFGQQLASKGCQDYHGLFLGYSDPCPPAASSLYASSSDGDYGSGMIEDALSQSTDPAQFLWEEACGDAAGPIIGPIQNVFTDDLQKFAQGVCKERKAHWQLVIPLGNVYDIDLGDIVWVSYETSSGLRIKWVEKKFWVTGIQLYLDGDKYTRQITVLEVEPEVFQIEGTGGSVNVTPAALGASSGPCPSLNNAHTVTITSIDVVSSCPSYSGPVPSGPVLWIKINYTTPSPFVIGMSGTDYTAFYVWDNDRKVISGSSNCTSSGLGVMYAALTTHTDGSSHSIQLQYWNDCFTSGLSNKVNVIATL